MKPKYALVTYATNTNILIRVSDAESSDAAWVTEKLNKISYEGQKSWWEVHSLWGQRGQGSGVLCETAWGQAGPLCRVRGEQRLVGTC